MKRRDPPWLWPACALLALALAASVSLLPRAWLDAWLRGAPPASAPRRSPPAPLPLLPELEVVPDREPSATRPKPSPPPPPPTLAPAPDWWLAARSDHLRGEVAALLSPGAADSSATVALWLARAASSPLLAGLADSARAARLGQAERRIREQWRQLRPLAAALGRARRQQEFLNIERRLFGEQAGPE